MLTYPKRVATALTVVLICLSSLASGQVYYLGAGFNGAFTGVKGLNQLVKNYNTTRPTNQDDLKNFGLLTGYTINAGGSVSKLWFDLELGVRGQKRNARDTDKDGVAGDRDFKLKNNSLGFTVGKLWQDKKPMMAVGLRADLGRLALRSKVAYENGLKQDWAQVQEGYRTLRLGPSFKVLLENDLPFGLGVILTAHYGIDLYKHNVTDWDIQLNHSRYGGAKPTIFDVRTSSFMVSVALARIAA
ncbi:MAG: hypothetical protein H6608_05880 [Flavobacteriales bacterium]|nr:hypothetical protein [Flavobacteriales bacterium]